MPKERCVFCDIIKGREDCYLVEESCFAICILDINPLQRGHCLVIPKRHVEFWYEMNEKETADLYNLARRVSLRLMKVYKPDFIMQYARGRRIPHTHIFLIPTFQNDVIDRYFNALEGFQEGAKFLSKLTEKDEFIKVLQEIRDG
ncbi:MAG: HIT family protein [Deltaproteobacteria bacterium]|nr:HIT family protein [Deltaproteobacteria bacterium]